MIHVENITLDETLNNIEWFSSLEGRISTACFRDIFHNSILIDQISDLLRIVDPSRMNNNADFYKEKRDNATQKQTKMYYHNKLVKMFNNADALTINLRPEDEIFYDLKIEDIREILNIKRIEYDIKEFRYKILYPYLFDEKGDRIKYDRYGNKINSSL